MADQKIDVHAHFIPPCYRKAILDNGYTNPDGMPGIPERTINSHLAYMDSVGIAKSILSISQPGTHLNSDTATIKTLTWEINEYAANVKRQYPARFGFFASLPLPDIAASVEEIRYALDTLDADNFVLHSNTAGIYLGDPVLRRVVAELDARRAVAFIHPTAACHHNHKHDSPSERNLTSSPPNTPLLRPLFEFFFDGARSLLGPWHNPPLPNLLQRGRPPLPPRPDDSNYSTWTILYFTSTRDSIPILEEEIRIVLRERFWWDLAGDSVPNLVDALLKFTSRERVVFVSDIPWTPFGVTKGLVGRIERDFPGVVGEEGVGSIWRGTAEGLLEKAKRLLGTRRCEIYR